MEALPAWVMGDDFLLTKNHTVKHYLKCLTKDEFVTYKDTSMTVCIFVTRVFVNKYPISCSDIMSHSLQSRILDTSKFPLPAPAARSCPQEKPFKVLMSKNTNMSEHKQSIYVRIRMQMIRSLLNHST